MAQRVSLEKNTAKRMGRATLEVEARSLSPQTQPNYGRFPGAHQVYEILLTATVAAAVPNAATKKIETVEFTAVVFLMSEDEDGSITWNTGLEVTGRSAYPDEVTVTEGKGRYGWLIDGRLLITGCTEFDIETEEEEE